ncbi:MAG: NAD(+)/NADH kinase [Mariprofundaceae bacterium]|nr:NAD(+)/NADH kinase [Mariprofundaceae bacterium]
MTTRIGISIKPNSPSALQRANELKSWLKKRDIDAFVSSFLDIGTHDLDHLKLMVVLGGDGTLLHTAGHLIDSDTPILGINMGQLGFLTETPLEDMLKTVKRILNGEGEIETRFCLEAEWDDGHAKVINDVVLQRYHNPTMMTFEMYVADQFVFNLNADGLILSTPTGSTAYSLSAGGSIVHPKLKAINVVPICPHMLSNRPILIPADDEIQLRVLKGKGEVSLNLDGQQHALLQHGSQVTIRCGGQFSLIRLVNYSYYRTLRNKLHWGNQYKDDL